MRGVNDIAMSSSAVLDSDTDESVTHSMKVKHKSCLTNIASDEIQQGQLALNPRPCYISLQVVNLDQFEFQFRSTVRL